MMVTIQFFQHIHLPVVDHKVQLEVLAEVKDIEEDVVEQEILHQQVQVKVFLEDLHQGLLDGQAQVEEVH
tara:strand:+ start:107 stop:316 length:210 start_codon:yes stop_codon:yes gene_type:complete